MSEQDGIDQVAAFSGTGSSSLSLGRELARLRAERGWSQEFVSERLKFAVRQIRALEAENWGELPTGMPLRGFVRNYARLLETDPEPLLSSLAPGLQASDPVSLNQASTLSSPIAPSPGRSANWPTSSRKSVAPWLVGGVMAVVAIVLLGYALQQQGKLPFGDKLAGDGAAAPAAPAVAETAPADAPPQAGDLAAQAGQGAAAAASGAPLEPPAPVVAGTDASTAVSAAAPAAPAAPVVVATQTQASAPASAAGGIAITAREACWVEVRRADGSVAISRNLAADENYQLEPAGAPYKVIIGNVKGVDLNWRGAPVDLGPYRVTNVARLTLQ